MKSIMNNSRFIVLTGGPGAGKTTIIDELVRRGFSCAEEIGRKVIKEQMAIDGDALPWKNKALFRDYMMAYEIKSYESSQNQEGLVFFDRGIVDVFGYSKLEEIEITQELMMACHRYGYNKFILILPPWESIFTNDTERKQDFSEAVSTYEEMVKAYAEFGYDLIEVPVGSVDERVKFILTTVQRLTVV